MAILKLKGVDLFVRKSGEDVGDWPHVKYRGVERDLVDDHRTVTRFISLRGEVAGAAALALESDKATTKPIAEQAPVEKIKRKGKFFGDLLRRVYDRLGKTRDGRKASAVRRDYFDRVLNSHRGNAVLIDGRHERTSRSKRWAQAAGNSHFLSNARCAHSAKAHSAST